MKTVLFTLSLFVSGIVSAQTFTVVADSLRTPFGLHFTNHAELLLTECGTGADDGTVSKVNPDGSLTPIITGMASIFDTVEFETIGPWRSANKSGDHDHVYVVSPITGGVLQFKLSGNPILPLTPADATAQYPIADFVYLNEPDTLPDSDPFSMAWDAAGNLYVCDAAFNGIVKVDATTGERSVFAWFPPTPNPLPFGPPFSDAVPTKIIAKPGGGFYVCQLTGFPFLDGTANVFEVSATGVISTYATGLSLLTDLYLDEPSGDLYALQIAQFVLDPFPSFAPNSAKITRIKPNGTKEIVAENFGPAVSLTFDNKGAMWVTEPFAGRLLKMDGVISATRSPENGVDFSMSPNPSAGPVQLSFSLKTGSKVGIQVFDEAGRAVFQQNLGRLEAGFHQTVFSKNGLAAGLFFVEISTENGSATQKLMLK